jgi:putative transcriptional regulator
MSGKVAQSIRRGLTQALAYAKKEARAAHYRVHISADIDVKAIREKLALTQTQFAARFGFSVNTLRHWEQGKRQPEGPSRAYLVVIAKTPKAVERAERRSGRVGDPFDGNADNSKSRALAVGERLMNRSAQLELAPPQRCAIAGFR